MLNRTATRPAVLAGSWYPADPARLARSIDQLLADAGCLAPGLPTDTLLGLIVPHAGHRYSGAVAAAAFHLLHGGRWDVIVLIGPNHRIPAPNRVLAANAGAYVTPLGSIPVAADLLLALAQNVPVQLLRGDVEHSLEVELPFLQRALSPLPPLLPLMVGRPDLAFAQRLAAALASTLAGRRALLLASSDWSHYYPDAVARQLDRCGIELLLSFNAPGLAQALAAGRTQACGSAALLATIALATSAGANRAVELAYATSGDVTGDRSAVVGYAAVALLRERTATESKTYE